MHPRIRLVLGSLKLHDTKLGLIPQVSTTFYARVGQPHFPNVMSIILRRVLCRGRMESIGAVRKIILFTHSCRWHLFQTDLRRCAQSHSTWQHLQMWANIIYDCTNYYLFTYTYKKEIRSDSNLWTWGNSPRDSLIINILMVIRTLTQDPAASHGCTYHWQSWSRRWVLYQVLRYNSASGRRSHRRRSVFGGRNLEVDPFVMWKPQRCDNLSEQRLIGG